MTDLITSCYTELRQDIMPTAATDYNFKKDIEGREVLAFNLGNKIVDFFSSDKAKKYMIAWKATTPINMGDGVRFNVNGSLYEGVIVVRYLALRTDEVNNEEVVNFKLFDVELGWYDGSKYEIDSVIKRVHVNDVFEVIDEEVMIQSR